VNRFRALALVALFTPATASALELEVYDSADLSTPIGLIHTIQTTGSGAQHYDFYSASGHPVGVNVANPNANIWVHENTATGEFSFGFIFGQDNNGAPSNSANFAFRIVDTAGNVFVAVSDDAGEATESTPGSFQGTFNYGNNTDGIMVSGITGTSWTIIVDSVDFGNVTNWYAASGEVANFSDDLSLTLGREYRITPASNPVSVAPVDPRDTDSDGVLDASDIFPCDATASAVTYAPSATERAMLMFEDHWPQAADLDFNDVVVAYRYAFLQDANADVSSILLSIDPIAIGGAYSNGLALHLPVPSAALTSAVRRVGGGADQSIPLFPGENEATVLISNDLRELFGNNQSIINAEPGVPPLTGQPLEIELTFATPQSIPIAQAPFDLFIFRSAVPSHEIHRTGYSGTNRMDPTLFGTADDGSTIGRWFVDTQGLPFALSIPTLVAYPREAMPIHFLYPDIVTFASSGGASNSDFYATNVQSWAAYSEPGAPTPAPLAELVADRSCVPNIGSSEQNPAISCLDVVQAGVALGDGEYWIDPDGANGLAPFLVDCDMSSNGGGWMRFEMVDNDGVLMAEYDASNPWRKCGGDSAQYYSGVSEGQVSPDRSGQSDFRITMQYRNPASRAVYSDAQVAALRTIVSNLHANTRIVATTSDDDNGNYQNDGNGGHEVYARGVSNVWTLLTPGEDGECGGGTGWPASGSSSGYYLWSTTAAQSVVAGTTSGATSASLGALDSDLLLPREVRIVVDTGGGASFGWEQPVFMLR
jgi:LruC domain-containing protein